MKIDGPGSSNIEDRRGQGGGFGGRGLPGDRGGMRGPGLQIPVGGGGGLFKGGFGIVAILVISLVLGVDPGALLGGMGGGTGVPPPPVERTTRAGPQEDAQAQFVSRVLASTETVWGELFPRAFGKPYDEPRLVLFRDSTPTACGLGQAAMGPFYCPADSKVYLDLSFFDELAQRFRAPGQFAQAYVVAHEIGHHVQNLLGISEKAHQMRARMSRRDGNALSVRVELQADCFAGVWAFHANRQRGGTMIDAHDVEQALTAATAIGDDRLQRQTQGTVVPDSFTHGTSAQRVRWFRVGLDSGELGRCDTFRAQLL